MDTTYVGTAEAARQLNVNQRRVCLLCKQGRIQGARMVSGAWIIPSPVIRLSPMDLAREDREALLTAAQAAEIMGVTRARITQLCKQGRVEGARQSKRRWFIPKPVRVTEARSGRPRKGTGE